jgi:hypothetical protein
MSSAAAKCSKQADLRLTPIDPIHCFDVPKRPLSTTMSLICIKKITIELWLGWRLGPLGPGSRGCRIKGMAAVREMGEWSDPPTSRRATRA